MPLYTYACDGTGKLFDRFLKLENYKEPQVCKCGSSASKQLAAPYVRGDYEPYECPVSGKMIEGRKAHEENLKRTGCRILEPGEIKDNKRNQAQAEASFEASVEETIEEVVAQLPTEKKVKLAAEIESGVDAQVIRQ